MRVLTINCGSSTLKFQVIDIDRDADKLGDEGEKASGMVDRVGGEGSISFAWGDGQSRREAATVPDHRKAMKLTLEWLEAGGWLQPEGIQAVTHRVVHGGDRYAAPVLINPEVMQVIEELAELAPLHNGPAVQAIRAAWEHLGNSIPMVAAFDTTFHHNLPERAYRYAIPTELADRHHIRRYGFHGLAHQHMMERYSVITGAPVAQSRLITLQLGNGCSVAAVAGGRSIDTSMGFTPLEGLMMGTRSGDLDPAVVSYLAQREGVGVDQVEDWLNRRSGLLGVSGLSHDMRDLLEAERQGNARAALAIDMFCYRARKYIGAYLAALGGADAVIFGGGIGEHAPAVRWRICEGLDWFGLALDLERNQWMNGTEGRISASSSRVRAYVVPVNEAVVMARETLRCLLGRTTA